MSTSNSKPTIAARIAAVLQHVPGGSLVFAVVPMVVLGYLGWFYYGAKHLDKAFYSVSLEEIRISPQPTWIKSDVRAEVFRNARLDRLSLLDTNANAALAHAFETHVWVRSATRVTKSAGGVFVDLTYRQPVAMIYYKPSDSTEKNGAGKDSEEGFYPVDADGVMLPSEEFSTEELERYFLIFADGIVPPSDKNLPFGDSRVREALKLCQSLAPVREQFRLSRIYVQRDAGFTGPNPWILTILTSDKRTILWGHAPGAEIAGEPSVTEKLTQLTNWFKPENASATNLDLMRPSHQKSSPVSFAP